MPKSWVSIHALLVECDTTVNQTGVGLFGFQSTHSLWSATLIDKCLGKFEQFQSTHSLWSATGSYCRNSCFVVVSIHALLVECDWRHFLRRCPGAWFQSTHSLWSATVHGCGRPHYIWSFNPRTPCGVRLGIPILSIWTKTGFNPRTPCGVRLRPTLYIATQQSKSYFAPTSLKRPSLHGCSF